MSGQALNAAQVKALADMPPLPVMRAQLLGVLQAPAGKLARTIAEPARGLAAVLKAFSEKATRRGVVGWNITHTKSKIYLVSKEYYTMAELNQIVEQLSTLSVLEAAELVKYWKRSGAFLLPLRWRWLPCRCWRGCR